MTRRLMIALLLVLWSTLLAGGTAAYLSTRSILVNNLDQAIVVQAQATAAAEHPSEFGPALVSPKATSYSVASRKLVGLNPSLPAPRIVQARFVATPAGRTRTLEVVTFARSGKPYTVVVSVPTAELDGSLNLLLLLLASFTLLTGLAGAGVARYIARSALRPLEHTAATIVAIDEGRLDRRIDATALPPELHPMAERLNEMLARLESSFKARRQFVADASHELRTPVAALVTSLEVALRRERELSDYVRVLEQALADARYLEQLAQGLLDTARAERHGEDTDVVDLAALVRQCTAQLTALAQQRAVALHTQVAENVLVSAPEARLRSVLVNLVSNAIEYNRPGGSVTVTLTRGPVRVSEAVVGSPPAEAVALQIADTGIGMAPEVLPQIFDPFYRVDSARTIEASSSAHLGLGLALVKRHILALEASLHVESTIGKGTIFTILLAPLVLDMEVQEARALPAHR